MTKHDKCTKPDGKLLEELVEWIQLALADHPSTRIQRNVKIKDLDGEDVQVDILVDTVVNETLPIRIVFECKDHNRKIEKKYIEEFHSRCERLPANKKVFVSTKGYQSGAFTKAKAFNIELLELKRISEREENISRIMNLFEIVGTRYNILSVGIYCPTLPDNAPLNFATVYLQDKCSTITLRDLANMKVSDDPPPSTDIEPGHFARTRKRVELGPNQYFVKYNDQYYELAGVVVEAIVFKGTPLGDLTPGRFQNSDHTGKHADIAAFKMPMFGGIGTVGSVVSLKTGQTKYLIETPRGVKGFSSKTLLHIKYQVIGDNSLQEVFVKPKLVKQLQPGSIELQLDFSSIPADSKIIEARLIDAPLPFVWSLKWLEVKCEGCAPTKYMDGHHFYWGEDRNAISVMKILEEALIENPPPYRELAEGEKKASPIDVHVTRGDLYLKADSGYFKIIRIIGEIEIQRIPE